MSQERQPNMQDRLRTVLEILSRRVKNTLRGEDENQQTEIKLKDTFDRLIRIKVDELLSIQMPEQTSKELRIKENKTRESIGYEKLNNLLRLEEYLAHKNYQAVLDETTGQQGYGQYAPGERLLFRAYAYEQIYEEEFEKKKSTVARDNQARALINYLDSLTMSIGTDPYDLLSKKLRAEQSQFYKLRVDQLKSMSQTDLLEKILSLLTDLGYQNKVEEIVARFSQPKANSLGE